MKIIEFIDFMKESFSLEELEKNENNFFEYFFYYKRNIRDFVKVFKTYKDNDQKRIVTFLLQLYPLSDDFLKEILKELKIELNTEISLDTINYIVNGFIENFKDLNIDFNQEIEKNFQMITDISSMIELNENKMKKLLETKKEYLGLKEKNDKLTKDIQELEKGNISVLKMEIRKKEMDYKELKNEKEEINKQYQKINVDLNELEEYTELREQINKCRDILKNITLPKDYTDNTR